MDRNGQDRCLFPIPNSPLVLVVYERDGVKQEAVLSNPRSNARLAEVMKARNVGLSQIQSVSALGKAIH